MRNKPWLLVGCGSACMALIASEARAVTPGFVMDFPGTNIAGWVGGAGESNPGTGGVGGVGDGFLRLNTPGNANLGVGNTTSPYTGNYGTSGIGGVSFWLNDVGTTNPALEMHFGLGIHQTSPVGANYWQYNAGFRPQPGVWSKHYISLSNVNPAHWTQTHGSGTLAAAMANVLKVNFRHDLAPYVLNPDTIMADVGIDRIRFHPVCPGETNGDDVIDFGDLNNVLSNFGVTGMAGVPGDVNNDGAVNFADVNIVLSVFGSTC